MVIMDNMEYIDKYRHIYEYANEILNEAQIVHKPHTVIQFCNEVIDRHSHLITALNLDENLRTSRDIPVTIDRLKNDMEWFKILCREFDIETEYMTIMQNQVWVTIGNKAMPITKYLAKKRDVLLSSRKTWYNFYEWEQDERGYDIRNVDGFLAQLGEITNMDKMATISVNPADYLRNAFGPKYCSFSTCHNLLKGSYKYGVINYALSKNHLVNYIHKKNSDKMIARVMMCISDDFNVVAQRVFYPKGNIFGKHRATVLRNIVHESLKTDFNTSAGELYIPSQRSNALGYIDDVTVCTYGTKPQYLDEDLAMSNDLYCFSCGRFHNKKHLYCTDCNALFQQGKLIPVSITLDGAISANIVQEEMPF